MWVRLLLVGSLSLLSELCFSQQPVDTLSVKQEILGKLSNCQVILRDSSQSIKSYESSILEQKQKLDQQELKLLQQDQKYQDLEQKLLSTEKNLQGLEDTLTKSQEALDQQQQLLKESLTLSKELSFSLKASQATSLILCGFAVYLLVDRIGSDVGWWK
jgi:hypothetical protein